jgi:hypothetical protein
VLPLAKVAVPVLVKVVNFPVDGEVAPIAGGLDRSNVPPKVRFPLLVTVPDNDIPLTVPVPPTEVTVPKLPVKAIPLALKTPVEGTKLNFVELVVAGLLPVVVTDKTG